MTREGCSRFVVTDVTKDGTLNGPNLELLAGVAERTDAPVIASGGVSSLDDLRAIATLTDAASRVRSSARRSTRGGSPCPRRSPR